MVDNIKPSQMNQINATTQQQVEEGKVEVLKSIASYFKDNLPTPGKKTSTGTLKSTEQAENFKNEVDKIITEGDLSGAFKKFNDKLKESGETISDYIDAQDDANTEFIKSFNEYSKERTDAERKQSNLARENIATRIDENNKLQILKNSEIRTQQDKMKQLRGEIEDIEDYLKRKKNLQAEEVSAKFDEIEEKRQNIRDIKELGVKEKKKFQDTMFRFNVIDDAIDKFRDFAPKTKKSISNFLDGITPEPIKTNFQLITSSISDALKPILTLFKPLKIFIPILKLFGAGFLKSLNLFKKSNKAVAKNNDTIKQHTVLTKDQMDATKKQTVLTKEQMEMQGKKSKKEGREEKKRTGIFAKLGGAVSKVGGFFSQIALMLPVLLLTIIPLIAVFLLFKNRILGFIDMIFGTNLAKPVQNNQTPGGQDLGFTGTEGMGAFLGDGVNDAELKKMAETQIDKENPEMHPYQKKHLARERKKELEEKLKSKEGREELSEQYKDTEFAEVIEKNIDSRSKKELINANQKLAHTMKTDAFSLKVIENQMKAKQMQLDQKLQAQLQRGSYQPVKDQGGMGKFQLKTDASIVTMQKRLEELTMQRNELEAKISPVKGEIQANTNAINNIDNSSRTTAVGGRRGVSNEDVSKKNHKVRYAN